MIGPRSGSRGDAQSAQHMSEICEWRDVLYGHTGVRVGRGGVPVEISSDEEPLVRHVQRHVVPQIAGVASAADVTQIAASQFSNETVLATHAALVEARRKFAVVFVHEDVFGGKSGGPAWIGDGDVQVFPLTDDARDEVPRPLHKRLVLVPGPRNTHRSVQDSSRHGQFTASESDEDSFLPVPGQMDDDGDGR